MVYETFSKKAENENDRLVFIAADKCISSEFDEITQSQKILLEDRYKNRLYMKARYSNESSDIIDRLAKTGKVMLANPGIKYVIFGSAYIENGRCYIYPIAVFDNIYVSRAGNKMSFFSEVSGAYKFFAELFKDVQNMLGDVIQCGINSFDLYAQMSDNADESKKMGLLELGGMLERLAESFKAKNHTYSDDNSKIVELLTKIYLYLKTGISKTEIYIAMNNLKESD